MKDEGGTADVLLGGRPGLELAGNPSGGLQRGTCGPAGTDTLNAAVPGFPSER